jgi:hypothetical protein
MAAVHHDFGSTVAWSAAISVSSIIFHIVEHLCKTKVDQLDVTLLVEEDVLWFQVPVNYVHAMKLLDPEHDFSDVELGVLLTHEQVTLDDFHELSTRQKINDHIEVVLILERPIQVAAEIIWLEIGQNLFLILDVLDLLAAQYPLLGQALDGVEIPSGLVSHKLHDAETALAKNLNPLEFVDGELLTLRAS